MKVRSVIVSTVMACISGEVNDPLFRLAEYYLKIPLPLISGYGDIALILVNDE